MIDNSGFHRKTSQVLAVRHKILKRIPKRTVRFKPFLRRPECIRKNILYTFPRETFLIFQFLPCGCIHICNLSGLIKCQNNFQRVFYWKYAILFQFHNFLPHESEKRQQKIYILLCCLLTVLGSYEKLNILLTSTISKKSLFASLKHSSMSGENWPHSPFIIISNATSVA